MSPNFCVTVLQQLGQDFRVVNEHAENDQDMERADEILVNKTGLFGLYRGWLDDILAF